MKDDCRCTNSYYANKPHLKLQAETTNKTTYVQHPLLKNTEFIPPKHVQKHYEPEVLKSSYKCTYTQPPPPPRTEQIDSLAQHFINKPKNVPFYSDTSYKQTYIRHDVPFTSFRWSHRGNQPMNISLKILSLKGSPAIKRSLSPSKIQTIHRVKIFLPIKPTWLVKLKCLSKEAAPMQILSRTTRLNQKSSLSTDTSRNRQNSKEAAAINK